MLALQLWLLILSPILMTAPLDWPDSVTLPAAGQTKGPPLIYWPGAVEPRLILISLKDQRLARYEDGWLIDSFPVSTGKRGHRTPVGHFLASVKDRDHESSEYPKPDGGAKMPYAIRFTWKGHWIHTGQLPGYPASHGCVRLLPAPAKRVYNWARIGMPIIVKRSFR